MKGQPTSPPAGSDASDRGALPAGPRAPAIGARYVCGREIGRGATGVVWEARDTQTGEPVAVKVLHPSPTSSPAARARFQREVTSAQALNHPHSVRVLAHGRADDGSDYLVMERLEGRTLAAVLATETVLPLRRAIAIVSQILDAMTEAHAASIVHRDLKPGNVLLIDRRDDAGDFVKVCDFGLAKVVADDDDRGGAPADEPITGHGELCGTPEYMAPEQARGEPIDGRADLYSIAVILFQALVGRLPFQGRTAFATVSQHLAAAPPRPSALRPDLHIPAALEALILRGLAKDRRERPSSAVVFRAELLQIERDLRRDERRERPGLANAATLPGASLAEEPRRSRRVLRFAAAGAAILTLAGVAVSVARRKDPAAQADPRAPSLPAPRPAPTTSVEAGRAETAPNAPAEITPATPAREARGARSARKRSMSGLREPLPPEAVAAAAPSPVATPTLRDVRDLPKSPEADIQRAEDLMAEGQVQAACALGEAVVSRAPALAAAHGFLGRCYARAGRPDDAKASYRRYLELAPDASDAPFVRAIVDRRRR